MEQEVVEESVLLDVFTSFKQDKNRGYLLVEDFRQSLLKHRPKCLVEYYPDQESLEACCDEMFTNMCEASVAEELKEEKAQQKKP